MDVDAALGCLSEPERAAVIMCHLEGLSRAEAAKALAIPEGTLSSRLANAMGKLRRKCGKPPLAVLAAAAVVLVPEALPASTIGLVRHLRNGSLQDWASPRVLDLYRKTRPMGRLDRFGRLATALAVAMVLILGATAGVHLVHAQPPESAAPQAPPPPVFNAALQLRKAEMLPSLLTLAILAADSSNQVELLVTDASTGKPLPGAVIRLFNNVRPTPYVFTDANGKAAVAYPKNGPLTIDVHTEKHIQQRLDLTEKMGRPASVQIKLRAGQRSVGGVVVDEDGKPVVGATVRLGAYLGKPQRPAAGVVDLVCDIDAVTDAQGRWSLQVVDESPNNLHFHVRHPDFVFTWRQPRPVAKDLLSGAAKTVLKRGIQVTGKVLDEQGHPVAGAGVVAAQTGEPVIDFTPRIVTKQDGAFCFVLAPGANTLTVQALGRSPGFRTLQIKEPTEVAFNLPRGRVVRGKVVDPEGKPVGGAGVTAVLEGGSDSTSAFRLWTIAKDDGSFELADSPADLFHLRGSKDGYLFNIGGVPVAPDKNDITIVIKPGPKLRGTVVDAATGTPVPEFIATLNFTSDSETPAQFGFNRHFIETKGKNGRFELTHSQTINSLAQIGVWAPGYRLARTETFPNDTKTRDFTLKLQKETRTEFAGAVKRPDGKPAAGALVIRGTRSTGSWFRNNEIVNEAQTSTWRRCDEQGKYSFPPSNEPFILGVSHETGYAIWKPRSDADVPGETRLTPWATIKGTFLLDGKPSSNQALRYLVTREIDSLEREPQVEFEAETTTTAGGGFVLDRVPAAPGRLLRLVPSSDARSGGSFVTIASLTPRPGETIDLAKTRQQGRTVVGRLKLPTSLQSKSGESKFVLDSLDSRATSDRPAFPYPAELKDKDRKAQTDWLMEWRKTPEARKYFAEYQRAPVRVEADGRFRIEGARPDAFVLTIRLRKPTADVRTRGDVLATATKKFVVPPSAEGSADEAIDLGEVDVVETASMRVGQKLPPIAAKGLDGGAEWTSSSESGKVLLIDFWATWCGPCIKAMPAVAELHKEYGGKGLSIVSLSADEKIADAEAFVKKEKCNWRQAHVGPRSPLLETLGIEGYPTFIVVGRDGIVLYRGHEIDAAASKVRTALAK